MSNVENTYEGQNDQRLDELHSKIRALRGVTTDIHSDVERQNLMLDDTGNTFSSFGTSLQQSGRNAMRAFGLQGGTKPLRLIIYVVVTMVALWVVWNLVWWFFGGTPVETP